MLHNVYSDFCAFVNNDLLNLRKSLCNHCTTYRQSSRASNLPGFLKPIFDPVHILIGFCFAVGANLMFRSSVFNFTKTLRANKHKRSAALWAIVYIGFLKIFILVI